MRSSNGPAETISPLADVVEIPDGSAEIVHDITVYRGLYIRGRVLDPSGAPVKGGYVSAMSEDARVFIGAQVEKNGSFASGPLVPGSYRLNASAYDGSAGSEPVTARAGDENVELRCRAGSAATGRVVDAKTKEPCRANVAVASRASKSIMMLECEADGVFRFKGLEPGPCDLGAHTEDGRAGILRGVELTSGSQIEGLVIEVSPGAHVRVRNESKAHVVSVNVLSQGVPVSLDGVEPGTSHVFVAPAGHVTVRFQAIKVEGKPERELDLAVGEEKEVVFDD
jgi:hypothetical protein